MCCMMQAGICIAVCSTHGSDHPMTTQWAHDRCGYAQTYLFSGPTFESQLFHHVHVTGIPYGKKCATAACALHLTICCR